MVNYEITKIKNFEKIINKNKNSMLQIMILYNMSCNDNYLKLNDEQKEKLIGVIYSHYLKDETTTDLGFFSDIVMNNYIKILEHLKYSEFDEITKIIINNL